MAKKALYEEITTTFDSESGEITQSLQTKTVKGDDEDDYIKIYKYLNTIFAFQHINQSLIPALIEISSYMTYADKGQTVVLYKSLKQSICDTLGIKMSRLNTIIKELKDADILRPKEDRGVYAVNPFVIARGKWSDIKQLRTEFDFGNNHIKTESIVSDRITGETIAKVVKTQKNNQIPGQLELDV